MNVYQSIFKVALAIATIAICSQYSFDLPWGEGVVPITLQSLAVLVWATILKTDEAFVAICFYLFFGSLGLPVFADGKSGVEVLGGSTAGYLWGFLISATTVAYLNENQKLDNLLWYLFLMILGTILILIPGIGYLWYLNDQVTAFELGFYPVWRGALVKIGIGALISFIIGKMSD